MTHEPPLFVDLDGTLIATDLLHESFLSAIRGSPWVAVQCVGWLLRGRHRLKSELAARSSIDVATLPYRESVLAFLREERSRGRRIVLATASWDSLARAVAAHLGLFDEVIATNADANLKGAAKARHLVALCGTGGFDYLGDCHADLAVWRESRHAYVVDGSGRLARSIPEGVEVKRVFETPGAATRMGAAVRALRPHQWAKNILLFLPLIAAHRLSDPAAVASAFVAFAAFCLAASSAYLLNDLLDLAADRAHEQKRFRPLASGALSIPWGLALFVVALVAAALVASRLPAGFQATIAAYVALTLAYSFRLKRVAMLDVVSLAGLYTLRVIAGGFAIGAPVSFWLLAFAMFVFFSLALVKRYAELLASPSPALTPGRGYGGQDAAIVLALGASSAMVSVMVLALYINGDSVTALYRHPEVLWLLCPLLVYWISRIWLLAARGEMHEDPVLFAIRDATSYFTAAASFAVIWMAT